MKEDKRLEVLEALWGGEPYCVRRDEEGQVVLPVGLATDRTRMNTEGMESEDEGRGGERGRWVLAMAAALIMWTGSGHAQVNVDYVPVERVKGIRVWISPAAEFSNAWQDVETDSACNAQVNAVAPLPGLSIELPQPSGREIAAGAGPEPPQAESRIQFDARRRNPDPGRRQQTARVALSSQSYLGGRL